MRSRFNCYTINVTFKAARKVFTLVNNSIEQLAKQLSDRISALLPGDAGGIKKDLEDSIHSLLQSTFSKMNLVSREEFDVQSAVLQRTREKLEQLEKQLTQISEKSPDKAD